jgi:hypothetical protein
VPGFFSGLLLLLRVCCMNQTEHTMNPQVLLLQSWLSFSPQLFSFLQLLF